MLSLHLLPDQLDLRRRHSEADNSASFAVLQVPERLYQMEKSPLSRSVSRGPRPGHYQRSYVKLKGRDDRDSDIRVNRT
jgi:hypothetical protein